MSFVVFCVSPFLSNLTSCNMLSPINKSGVSHLHLILQIFPASQCRNWEIMRKNTLYTVYCSSSHKMLLFNFFYTSPTLFQLPGVGTIYVFFSVYININPMLTYHPISVWKNINRLNHRDLDLLEKDFWVLTWEHFCSAAGYVCVFIIQKPGF